MVLKYRKATLNDIEEIWNMVRDSVCVMERHNIFQWDDLYPAKEDFQKDIGKNQLYVGLANNHIVVVYALNQECEKVYENGNWKYKEESLYTVYRLCVSPNFQNMIRWVT